MYVGIEKHGQPWDWEDIKILIDLYSQGVRWGLIAGQLQRTVPACVLRLRTVRFYHKMPQDLYDYENDALTDKKLEYLKRI